MGKKNKDNKILTQAEIARRYNVSRPTAGKWIQDAIDGRNQIQLEKHEGKYYASNTEHNQKTFLNLKKRSVKYRNRTGYDKVVVPKNFYNHVDQKKLIELITRLEDNYIPTKFSYIDKGAYYWDRYIKHKEATVGYEGKDILEANLEYLAFFFSKYEVVNLIDIGFVNGSLSLEIIKFLKQKGFQINYTSVDSSKEMFKYLSKNLKSEIPDLEIKRYEEEIDKALIRDLLFEKRLSHNKQKVCNLLLFLDYQIGNYIRRDSVIKNLRNSMSKNDYLLISNGIAGPEEDIFVEEHLSEELVLKRTKHLPKMLGLTDEMVEYADKYSTDLNGWVSTISFKKDIDLIFQIKGQEKIVSFLDGHEVILYYIHIFNEDEIISLLNDNNLLIYHLSFYPLRDEALILCGIASERVPSKR